MCVARHTGQNFIFKMASIFYSVSFYEDFIEESLHQPSEIGNPMIMAPTDSTHGLCACLSPPGKQWKHTWSALELEAGFFLSHMAT